MGFRSVEPVWEEGIWTTDKKIKVVPEGEFLNIQMKLDDDVELIPPNENDIFTIKLKGEKVRQLWSMLDFMKPSETQPIVVIKKKK